MQSLPFLTGPHPGVAGRIKVECADFQVDEIPAYAPCGSGEHLYLRLEKTDLGADFFIRQIARRLKIPRGEVGVAGLKDRRAVTTQWVSVPASAEAHLSALEGDGIRILEVSRHSNKLRPGHLKSNRFRILIRDARRDVDPEPILKVLESQGVPNFYGPQRFGRDGETARLGLALLHGEKNTVRNPFLKKLALSAAQSLLFNDYLARRIQDGLFRTVIPGDAMARWPAGGMFTAQDVATEQARFDAREIVTAGPMFGRKTFPSQSQAQERETTVLHEHGLGPHSFSGFGKLLQGTRRHNQIYIEDLQWNWEEPGLLLSFSLPSGCYATVLLRELMKVEVSEDDQPPGDGAHDE